MEKKKEPDIFSGGRIDFLADVLSSGHGGRTDWVLAEALMDMLLSADLSGLWTEVLDYGLCAALRSAPCERAEDKALALLLSRPGFEWDVPKLEAFCAPGPERERLLGKLDAACPEALGGLFSGQKGEALAALLSGRGKCCADASFMEKIKRIRPELCSGAAASKLYRAAYACGNAELMRWLDPAADPRFGMGGLPKNAFWAGLLKNAGKAGQKAAVYDWMGKQGELLGADASPEDAIRLLSALGKKIGDKGFDLGRMLAKFPEHLKKMDMAAFRPLLKAAAPGKLVKMISGLLDQGFEADAAGADVHREILSALFESSDSFKWDPAQTEELCAVLTAWPAADQAQGPKPGKGLWPRVWSPLVAASRSGGGKARALKAQDAARIIEALAALGADVSAQIGSNGATLASEMAKGRDKALASAVERAALAQAAHPAGHAPGGIRL